MQCIHYNNYVLSGIENKPNIMWFVKQSIFVFYSLPIHVCWNLTISMPSTNTTPSGTPSSRFHPLLASGYQYRCNYTTNCVTFNTTHRFVFNCTFNHTGDYQIKASFYNSASSGNILYKFTVAKRENFSVCM